jgi:hypothetical protein
MGKKSFRINILRVAGVALKGRECATLRAHILPLPFSPKCYGNKLNIFPGCSTPRLGLSHKFEVTTLWCVGYEPIISRLVRAAVPSTACA